MYLPKETLTIDDTRLIGYWHDNKVPVYEVTTVHGLNQIVGHIKHNNANHGTVLYRGQANLHERLIPSVLHGSPTHSELVKRADELSKHIEAIIADKGMRKLLHFDENMTDRSFYKRYVVESMLQHYGVRTHFQDFVDNHWTALWFGLYELKKDLMPECTHDCEYYYYHYARRAPRLKEKCKAPECLSLKAPELSPLPDAPALYPILQVADYTEDLLEDQKSLKEIKGIADQNSYTEAFQNLAKREIGKKRKKNEELNKSWEAKKKKVELSNQEKLGQYALDQESDIAYMYLLLYIADTRGENFKGAYAGTETITIDLRKAIPSTLLRPCAQHGWTVKKIGDSSDLSDGVVCVLRLQVSLVDQMMGAGILVSQENFFPTVEHDTGYRTLLKREAPAPFGNPPAKYKRDLPSLFPFGTFQHFVTEV